MISFAPFRKLIQERNISTYYLRCKCGKYNLDSKTIQRLMNDESVSTNTIDSLCQVFGCEVADIMEVKPDNDGRNELRNGEILRGANAMTFSQFAKILYPYCCNGDSQANFVIRLTDQIMDGQPGRTHMDEGYQNPLRGKDERTLAAYFSGDRALPQKTASQVFGSQKKCKFKKFLRNLCSESALKQLRTELASEIDISHKKNLETEAICADLFVEILENLAKA